jgi:hypothetical protein
MEKFTFNTGGINLSSGQQYIAFMSASIFFDGVRGGSAAGRLDSNVYSGGQFFFLNNGSDFSLLTANPWFTEGGDDLAFQASFSAPVPIPGAVWLMGSALAGLAGLSRRREGAIPA